MRQPDTIFLNHRNESIKNKLNSMHSAFHHSKKDYLLQARFWRGIKYSIFRRLIEWLAKQLESYRCRHLSTFSLFPLLAWSPCPSSVCWGFRMEMNPNGVSGISLRYTIQEESRCTSTSHGWTESMGFQRCKMWVSQWFWTLKSHCGCAHCADTCCSRFIRLHQHR